MANGQIIVERLPAIAPNAFYRINVIDNGDDTVSLYIEELPDPIARSTAAAVTATGKQVIGGGGGGSPGGADHSVQINQGGAFGGVLLGADQILVGVAASDPVATDLSSVLPAAANPSASVGLAAINGAAATFMRSDAAPALSQAIVPTWTGLHTFTVPPLVKVTNATTNAVDTLVTIAHDSSGAPAAGFGAGLKFQLQSSTTVDRDAGQVAAQWADAADASRASVLSFYVVYSGGALTEMMRLTPGSPSTLKLASVVGTFNGAGIYNNGVFADAGNPLSLGGNGTPYAVISNAGSYIINGDVAIARNAASVLEVNNSAAGQLAALLVGTHDASTNTITNGLTIGHQSTGTPTAGLGSGLLFNIDSSTTADQNAARITASWTTATHASRTAQLQLLTVTNAGALAPGLTINQGAAVLQNYTAATLPSASGAGAGALAFVTDATLTAITGLGLPVTGGGTNKVPVYSDGTDWIII